MSLSDKQFNDLVMPLYDSLLQRLQSLPLSVTSLNALVPLLTAAFSRIPPPALGPAAFRRFFCAVHARLAAPSNAYSDELRVCLDACVRGYGGEWPPGMVPLSSTSQTQSQFQLEARSTIGVPVLAAACEVVEEPIPHLRSIAHEVIPDSQYAISDAAFPNAQNVPSPTRFVTEPSKENHESRERTGLFHNPETKKRRLPHDMPASKRRRATTSTNGGLRTHSVPLPRIPSSVVPGRRSNSTSKASPYSRLVMDCVEVVPLRGPLHRREPEAARHDKRGQQLRSGLDDHAFDVTPERPFVPSVSRALPGKDEIVPETPDAVLRPDRMSLPTGQESSEQFPLLAV
ncbi:hypothetical protein BC827DRAFT_887363 [Russula dissimulans]|nr:hypothetical protein BC827DRAFT_887363 [Russula dissimulans]